MRSAFLRCLLSFALSLCLGTVALAQQPAAPARPAGPPPAPPVLDGKKAGQVYKNLKVLKDVDAVKLVPTMRFFAGSLGVGCDHCHKAPDWQLDVKKEKATARQMIQMVRAINKNPVFKGQQEVTCNTCHRGSAKPEGIPEVTQAVWAKPPAPEVGPLPSADEVFAKYVAAVGGQGAVEGLKTRVIKSTLGFKQSTTPLMNFNVEVDVASPDKIYLQQQGQRGSVISAIDGKKGWTKAPFGVRDLAPSQIEEVEEQAGIYNPIQLGEYTEKKVTGKETVNGHETYVVEAKGKLPEKLFFDTQSGLLVRRLTFIETAFGLSPRQLEFDDYREVGGVKVPFSIADKEMTDLRQIKVNDVQNNVEIDASRFARPAAAQGQGQ